MSKSITPFKPANGSGSVPFSREMQREHLDELAGVTEEERAIALRLALDKLFAKLEAKKTEILSYKGMKTDTVELEDHATQLAAIAKIMDWCDAIRGKGEGGDTAPVKFVINFPDWHKPAIDVEAKVVDAGNSQGK